MILLLSSPFLIKAACPCHVVSWGTAMSALYLSNSVIICAFFLMLHFSYVRFTTVSSFFSFSCSFVSALIIMFIITVCFSAFFCFSVSWSLFFAMVVVLSSMLSSLLSLASFLNTWWCPAPLGLKWFSIFSYFISHFMMFRFVGGWWKNCIWPRRKYCCRR